MRLVCFPPPQLSSNAFSLFFTLFQRVILSPAMEIDIQFMQEALGEARAAAAGGEVPIGAVLLHDGKILARSVNRAMRDNHLTAHAEQVVLREAVGLVADSGLAATRLYVYIEPCILF